MIRALFSVVKTFVVVKAVDAVIGAFTRPRASKAARSAAAPARKATTKSKPSRTSKRRASA